MKNTLFDNEIDDEQVEFSRLDTIDLTLGKSLLSRVDSKYAPAFDRLPEDEQLRAALYFLPHSSQKETLSITRPRVIKWYCPFADQALFPSGVRYCINVYTGCEHGCNYCYVQGYSGVKTTDAVAKCKDKFRRLLIKDLADIENYDVPCTPLHLSNSTDAFGPIENEFHNSLFTLEKILDFRHRFSTITILTKNPNCLLQPKYLNLLLALCEISESHPHYKFFQKYNLPPLWLEVSLAFWNDKSREILEPGAPTVAERLDAVSKLQNAGVPVALRIDPLFPRIPEPGRALASPHNLRFPLVGSSIAAPIPDFGLMDFQSLDDLRNLVSFCKDNKIKKIIYSPLKITKPRIGELPETMRRIKRVYEYLAGQQRLEFRGGSWRLPEKIAHNALLEPLLELCREAEITTRACKENLLARFC
ncbi:MAG: radical SAM protein [Thermoguttaceae bacterium]